MNAKLTFLTLPVLVSGYHIYHYFLNTENIFFTWLIAISYDVLLYMIFLQTAKSDKTRSATVIDYTALAVALLFQWWANIQYYLPLETLPNALAKGTIFPALFALLSYSITKQQQTKPTPKEATNLRSNRLYNIKREPPVTAVTPTQKTVSKPKRKTKNSEITQKVITEFKTKFGDQWQNHKTEIIKKMEAEGMAYTTALNHFKKHSYE